jgi:gamma-glutamyltranspeptidase/glutathione hydrolase
VFTQPQLATCLRRLSQVGVQDFYRGEIARAIDRDMRRNDGLLDLADLAGVRPPLEREPLRGCYRDHVVVTMPPPGGGPQLLHALASLEDLDSERWRNRSDIWYQAIASAVQGAFRHRDREHRQPADTLDQRAAVFHGVARERDGETTHLCSADASGNVVSLTQSIQSLFGAKVANLDCGFFYNNYLTTYPRRNHTHRLASGGSARSNAAPTLIFSPGGASPSLALGAAGSRRIISSLVQVVSGVVDLALTPSEAISGPRVHPRVRGKVLLERPAASPSLVAWLDQHHGEVSIRRKHSYTMGAVQALQINGSEMAASADPRRDGATARW